MKRFFPATPSLLFVTLNVFLFRSFSLPLSLPVSFLRLRPFAVCQFSWICCLRIHCCVCVCLTRITSSHTPLASLQPTKKVYSCIILRIIIIIMNTSLYYIYFYIFIYSNAITLDNNKNNSNHNYYYYYYNRTPSQYICMPLTGVFL